MNVLDGIKAFDGEDADMSRIFWRDGRVHQNITHAVHPDSISGTHCWHQKVRFEKAHPGDCYGDLLVDTEQSFQVYIDWLENSRPARVPEGLRRPLCFKRPLKSVREKFYLK